MLAQPGWPAFVNTFHIATITTSATSSPMSRSRSGLEPYPCSISVYSACASKRAGVNKTVCVISMSEFIKVKSYARFKRLLPTQQAKSFAEYIARHLAMLATCRMHFLMLPGSKTEAHEWRQRASRKPNANLVVPNHALYQAKLRPELSGIITTIRLVVHLAVDRSVTAWTPNSARAVFPLRLRLRLAGSRNQLLDRVRSVRHRNISNPDAKNRVRSRWSRDASQTTPSV